MQILNMRTLSSIAVAVSALVVVVATIIIIFMWPWLRPPPTYRFPVPPETLLTEEAALEFSRRALVASGENTAGVRPIPYDDEGRYFAMNPNDPARGYVRWQTPRGTFSVRVEKEGPQLVCQIYRMK
jgi:hypothetical protein